MWCVVIVCLLRWFYCVCVCNGCDKAHVSVNEESIFKCHKYCLNHWKALMSKRRCQTALSNLISPSPSEVAEFLPFLLSALCLNCPSLLSVWLTLSHSHIQTHVWLFSFEFSTSLQPFISVWRMFSIIRWPSQLLSLFHPLSFHIISSLHPLTIIWHFKGAAGYYNWIIIKLFFSALCIYFTITFY